MPGDVQLGLAQAAVVAFAEARDECLDATARQAAREASNELTGAAGAAHAVKEARNP